MTNEEKARQITDEVFVMDAIIGVETSKQLAEICCKKMAEWKDEQLQEQKELERKSTYADFAEILDMAFNNNKAEEGMEEYKG